MSLSTKVSNSARVDSTSSSSVRLEQTVEFKAWAKKSTISFTRVSLRMIFTMVTVDIFIPMATSIWEIGLTVSAQDGENWSISRVRYTKECGNTANS